MEKDKTYSPEYLYNELIREIRSYHFSENMKLIRKAYEVAFVAHAAQKRKSGEPFIIHPLQVAIILAKLHLDRETIAAALLHDTIEDTELRGEMIKEEFGGEVLFLVEGVTKLRKTIRDEMEKDKQERKEASLRKLLLATVEDVRVVIIKLADRLHNMRTLEFQRREKQIEIAEETMEIYVPIANKLGIFEIKKELEELAFYYLYPEEYKALEQELKERKSEESAEIQGFVEEIRRLLKGRNIPAKVRALYKNNYSIYQKIKKRDCSLKEMYDTYAVNIILESFEQCYLVMGYLHNAYNPLPGRFKDFIALPKGNLYQAIHTTLISKKRKPVEVQIRTVEMEDTSQVGILHYWKYSSGHGTQMEKMEWLKDILDWQKDLAEENFTDFVKTRLSRQDKKIFCFTPDGKSIELPYDSIVMDFAYQIHSQIGDETVFALVNGEKVMPDAILNNGDRVQIITGQRKGSFPYAWIEKSKTARARGRMMQANRKQ